LHLNLNPEVGRKIMVKREQCGWGCGPDSCSFTKASDILGKYFSTLLLSFWILPKHFSYVGKSNS